MTAGHVDFIGDGESRTFGHETVAGRFPVKNNFHMVPVRRNVARPGHPVCFSFYHLFRWKYHVINLREDVLKWNEHVEKRKIHVAATRAHVPFNSAHV